MSDADGPTGDVMLGLIDTDTGRVGPCLERSMFVSKPTSPQFEAALIHPHAPTSTRSLTPDRAIACGNFKSSPGELPDCTLISTRPRGCLPTRLMQASHECVKCVEQGARARARETLAAFFLQLCRAPAGQHAPDHHFDVGLPRHAVPRGFAINLAEHVDREIDVDALDGCNSGTPPT
jgi:hypothetical protein